jgi:hypothetical protein
MFSELLDAIKTNKPQRAQQATAPMSTSESEEEPTTRTYAAVVAQPGTTTTTPPTEGRLPPPGPPGPRSPSPVAGGSGQQQLQLQPARSSKKRKRELPKPAATVRDSEDEDVGTDTDSIIRTNHLMQMERSKITSRAVQLQLSLEEYQQGLGKTTNLLEQAKRREDELRAQHSLEMKAAASHLNELNDQENRRILAAYRQQVRYRKRMKNYMSSCLEFITRMTGNLIHSIIDPETKIIMEIKTGKKLRPEIKITDLKSAIKNPENKKLVK